MSIINATLLVDLGKGNIVLLTYFPFTATKCRDFKPVIINRYLASENRWANNNYFPSKLENFYGCPLICCTWPDMPYFGLISNKQGTNFTDYTGFEAELLKYAAEKLNFSIQIHWIAGDVKDDVNEEATIFGKVIWCLEMLYIVYG